MGNKPYPSTYISPRDDVNHRSLLSSINRFMVAVKDMEATVLVPSLLKDVSLDVNGQAHLLGCSKYVLQEVDLYSAYLTVQRMKLQLEQDHSEDVESDSNYVLGRNGRDIKSGICPACQTQNTAGHDSINLADLQYHVHELMVRLDPLIKIAKYLTKRYNEEISKN